MSLVEGGEGADYDENTNIFNPPSGFEPIRPTPSPEPTVEPTMTPGSPQATPGEQTPTTTPAPTKLQFQLQLLQRISVMVQPEVS